MIANAFNFILITFPGKSKSIMRMGVFREVFDNEIDNAVVLDYSFWSINDRERIDLVMQNCREDANNIVVFVPGAKFRKYIPTNTIKKLRNKSNIQSIVCYLADGIERQAAIMGLSNDECCNMFNCFDVVYSYDLYESKKYGFVYEPLPLKKFEIKMNRENTVNLFFCGRSKGRLELLTNIAKLCENNGIKYEFLVLLDKETEKCKAYGNIKFIDYIIYDQLVEKIANASCLLSLVAANNNMTSASYNEAIMYNKKLLTNCLFLSENEHFNAHYMKSFSKEEEIDFEWIKSNENVDYKYSGYFSAKVLFEHIMKDYTRGFLRKCNKYNKIITKKKCNIDLHFSTLGWISNAGNTQRTYSNHIIEAIRLSNVDIDSLKLETMSRNSGYHMGISEDDTIWSGTTGKSDPIYAFCIRCDSENCNSNILYRAYDRGWTGWYKGGEWCGTHGRDSAFCGVQIIFLEQMD